MSSHAFLVFASKADADEIIHEIAATPDIESGIGPCWVWFPPDNPELNAITYAALDDGRVVMAHPWSEPDREWISIYCDDWISAGKMWVLDTLPGGPSGQAVTGVISFTPINPVAGEAVTGEITFRYTLE